MSSRVYMVEAWHELRSGLRSALVPLMFVGLVAYVFTMLGNAQYLRDMGGADVPRNSSLIVFQMTAGQSFWLIFAWAWVFAQVITRDRNALLHELVLAAPVSVRRLFIARYLGAVALACILGSSSSVALLLVPVLGAVGILPEHTIGPTPFIEIAYAWLLFVLPSALGLGAVYVMAALRTRSSAGPFAAAAAIVLAWMVAMVMLRGAAVHSDLATLIDASGFGEAEYQTSRWTPAQKARGLMALTDSLLLNRALWVAIPLGLLWVVLGRLRRDTLVVEQDRKIEIARRIVTPIAIAQHALARVKSPSWLRATLSDARWQLARATSGWTFVLVVLLWTILNVAAPFVHMLGHAEGPLMPRGQILAPFLLNLSYIFSVFIVAGYVGTLARRDHQLGFAEMLDAAPAPVGVRVLASGLAAACVTLVLAFIPTLSAWLVMALVIPEGFDLWSPVLVNGLVSAPALLELCALTFAVHALVRSAGTAHALAMLAMFIAIVNHETRIVSYPPAQLGIPAHVVLSELTGFRPWLAAVGALDAFKMSSAALLVACAWLAYPRGTALTSADRWRAAWHRFIGGAGALTVAACVALVGIGWLLHDRLVTRGAYRTSSEREQQDAIWEQRYWQRAGSFTIVGGEVHAVLDPEARSAKTTVALHGVHSSTGRLSGELPAGTRAVGARLGAEERDVSSALDHFELELGTCPTSGCELTLELELATEGWGLDETPPWLHPSGIWARATDLLPRFGLDAERRLRSPTARRSHSLPEVQDEPPASALAPAIGVAPAGRWRWTIQVNTSGEHTALEGETEGPLDFALAWLPEGQSANTPLSELSVWHGPTRGQVAAEIVQDLRAMQICVSARTGLATEIDTVLQAPRGLGALAVHGSVLWRAGMSETPA